MIVDKVPWDGHMKINWAACQKTYLQTCAPREDSDQPAHSRSLIRIFTGRILDSQGCPLSSCGQWRLWSHCTDAQGDLSLRWTYVSEGSFYFFAAQLTPFILSIYIKVASINSQELFSRLLSLLSGFHFGRVKRKTAIENASSDHPAHA